MKTVNEVVERVIPIVNVQAVTILINGGVFGFKRPLNSTLQDIIIVPLPVNGSDGIQSGILNINCYCENFSNGTPKTDKLNEISQAVILAILSYSSLSEYFSFEIVWQHIMDEGPDYSFANIRIRYFIENEN